jgi:S1-C subfamily serine protease
MVHMFRIVAAGPDGVARRPLFKSLIVSVALVSATMIAVAQSPPILSPTPTETATTIVRPPAPSAELNTVLMHATFLITGPSSKVAGGSASGTIFIMGIPQKDDPKLASLVIVTAAHVLNDIAGDMATLLLRIKNDDGTYQAIPFEIPIRENGKPLYVKHPTADVVAMYAKLPSQVPISGLPPDTLATDQTLEDIDVHPGDEAFVLGFPLAVASPGGFPILRVGHIMSYPLTPMKKIGRIDFDLTIYPGNSGGPVYFSYANRVFKNSMHLGTLNQGILGLVIQETHSSIPQFASTPLNYGIVVPAPFIRETLEMLPPPPDESQAKPQPLPQAPSQPDYTGSIK